MRYRFSIHEAAEAELNEAAEFYDLKSPDRRNGIISSLEQLYQRNGKCIRNQFQCLLGIPPPAALQLIYVPLGKAAFQGELLLRHSAHEPQSSYVIPDNAFVSRENRNALLKCS